MPVQVLHDENGRVWLMLHSGSRNIGNITAQNYDKIAQGQLAAQNIQVPGGLNYLKIDSTEGQQYLQVPPKLGATSHVTCRGCSSCACSPPAAAMCHVIT